ncbi:MAG: molybdopterin-dependent oxidoreductase [Chloroflexi bacterium]|nr:molybdopterin-dependent oxidoreductase [Chloroflexota bacterium]
MPEYKVIGRPALRVDAAEKATGKAVYTQDVKLPGLLYAKVLRSPYPHARILRVDTSVAERMPGVKAVLTIRDVPQHRTGLMLQDHYIFAKDKVRHVGDEIAAVAAVDEETAQKAVEAIEVDYEELPSVFDVEEAMREGAPVIHEDLPSYDMGPGHQYPHTMKGGTNICGLYKLRKGDVDKGFQGADYVFEDTFKVHTFYHGYIEPHACTASYDPTSGKVTVWTSTQRPFMARAYLSKTFNLPMTKVRVVGTRVGGGFGGKTRPRHERFPVALSMKTGRPVNMVMTRDEDIAAYCSPAAVVKLKMGVKADGAIVALAMDMIWDTGGYGESIHYSRGPIEALPGPYDIPNVKIDSYAVYTNKMPAYSYRGRIMPQPTFAVESALDIISERLGLDPVEVRMKNLFQEGSINAAGQALHSVGARDCLQKVAQAIGWGRAPGPNRGISVVSYHKYPPTQASSAVVRLNEDGTVQLICGAPEIGQGTQTALSMICAEELGVPLEDVSMPIYDTDHTPFEAGAIGDRITTCAGNAIRIAAADARAQALAIAANMLKVNKEDLTVEDGRILVRDAPEMWTTLPRVCAAAHTRLGGPIVGRGSYLGNDSMLEMDAETGQMGGVSRSWKYGAQAAEVEVDPQTGEVKVLKVVCAQDVGKAINPLIIEGQMDGAVLMGLGLSLWEETAFDEGKVANPNFMDYRLPTAMEGVSLEHIIVEHASPDGPFGAKGAGEQSTVPTAAVMANAIYNAVGVRIKDLPLTAEKVLSALGQQRAQSAGRI